MEYCPFSFFVFVIQARIRVSDTTWDEMYSVAVSPSSVFQNGKKNDETKDEKKRMKRRVITQNIFFLM